MHYTLVNPSEEISDRLLYYIREYVSLDPDERDFYCDVYTIGGVIQAFLASSCPEANKAEFSFLSYDEWLDELDDELYEIETAWE